MQTYKLYMCTGPDARVNWVSCEDIGAAGAALLVQALLPKSVDASSTSFQVRTVDGRIMQCPSLEGRTL